MKPGFKATAGSNFTAGIAPIYAIDKEIKLKLKNSYGRALLMDSKYLHITIVVPPSNAPSRMRDDKSYSAQREYIVSENITTDNIEIEESKSIIKIFPNPTTGIVYINTDAEIKVYNTQGMHLKTTFDNQVDLSEYPPNTYLFQINGIWHKIVKQ